MSKILIVEDEQVVAHDIALSLRALGYQITKVTASAEECLMAAAEELPDLVLMDIHIDGEVDGVQAASELHQRYDLPVVFLTAYADDVTITRAKQTAPLGYVIKPFRRSDLKSAVEVGLFRHQLERQLREQQRWFSATLHAIGDGVIAVDSSERVQFVNGVAATALGVTHDQARGRQYGELFELTSELTRQPLDNPLRLAMDRDEIVRLESGTLMVGPHGALPIEDSIAPIKDDRGELLGAVMVFQDVTDKRRMFTRAAQAEKMAALGTLAAGVGHEINNPLTYMLGNAQFARDSLEAIRLLVEAPTVDREEVRRQVESAMTALKEIDDGAQHIGQIVTDLRGFTSREQATSGDVNSSILWALRVAEHLIRSKCQLVTHLEQVPDVGESNTRLGQLFLNIIINAAQAMSDQERRQNQLHVSSEEQDDGAVLVTVRDTGCGMELSTQQRMFEPFFTTKPTGLGTGLGLFVAHTIVREAGGRVDVESTPGEGTTVRVSLPAGPRQLPGNGVAEC